MTAGGLRLALSWLTVLPVRGPDAVDRTAAGRAIAVAPLVGVLLGGAAASLARLADGAGASPAITGLLVVAACALLTRGMHLDGLADTADGLGSYGPPERAREIMKSGSAGPFGVAAIVLVLGLQAAAFAALAEHRQWFALGATVATGRVVVVLACRRGVSAAPGTGFGALVAGTQPVLLGAGWALTAVAAAVFATPDRPWLGPLTVVAAVVVTVALVRHTVRRFGGLTGDVLGAAVEISVAITAVGCALHP
ncbi:adenosylcobinamide-GDP ribazoletransferase [Nocardia takedensis]